MKAGELAKILNENPNFEVVVALGSFRVDNVKEVREEKMNNQPIFSIIPLHYKQVETKGIDF